MDERKMRTISDCRQMVREDTNQGASEGSFRSSPMEYQDIRDDRVYTYFGLPEKKTNTYYIQLNAAYLGRYFLPGTYCTAMYDNTIKAGTNGRWIEVRAGK